MRRFWIGLVVSAGAGSAHAWDDTRRITSPPPSCAAGVQCRVAVTPGALAGQVKLEFIGRAPALGGRAVPVQVYDAAGTLVSERSPFAAADGSLSVLVANGQTLQPGRYRYVIQGVAQGRFEVTSGATAAATPATAAAPARPAPRASTAPSSVAALAGTWYGIAGTPGSIELGADGSYKLNGRAGGRYRQDGDGLVFDGALAAWNKGRAALKDGVIEFHWKNAEGFNNWFVFQKGS